MSECFVYAYRDPETSTPFYIGKGQGNRHLYHLNEAKKQDTKDRNKHKINKIRSILKVGKEPVIEIVAKNLNHDDAFELEEFLIQEIGRADKKAGPLTNLTNGGEGATGLDHSGEKNPNYGKIGEKSALFGRSHSEESKRKMSESQKGRVFSEQHKQNMRKPKSEAGRKAIQEARKNMTYRPSEETKQKTREALLGRVMTEEHRNKISMAHKGTPKPRGTCKYCGKVAAVHLISRWHGTNCRNKPND